MKKVKIQSKLSLDKMAVVKLNDKQSGKVVGGDLPLSLLRCGTLRRRCHPDWYTDGVFCRENTQGPN
jgi:hypothetical protein